MNPIQNSANRFFYNRVLNATAKRWNPGMTSTEWSRSDKMALLAIKIVTGYFATILLCSFGGGVYGACEGMLEHHTRIYRGESGRNEHIRMMCFKRSVDGFHIGLALPFTVLAVPIVACIKKFEIKA